MRAKVIAVRVDAALGWVCRLIGAQPAKPKWTDDEERLLDMVEATSREAVDHIKRTGNFSAKGMAYELCARARRRNLYDYPPARAYYEHFESEAIKVDAGTLRIEDLLAGATRKCFEAHLAALTKDRIARGAING